MAIERNFCDLAAGHRDAIKMTRNSISSLKSKMMLQ